MKIKPVTAKVILGILTVSSILLLSPKAAFANGVSLKISPTLFEIKAKPPADIWAPFTIENEGSQPINLFIGYKAFDPQASQNGKVIFLKNGQQINGLDKNIFNKIQVVTKDDISLTAISLGPKQSMPLRLHITLPDNEPDSDYYFSLIFLENQQSSYQNISNRINNDHNAYSSLLVAIGANVLLSVGDKKLPQATIDNFSTQFIREGGPVPFTVTVFNNGSQFITPTGLIIIKNMFGQTIGKITLPSTVILAGTSRTFASNISVSNAKTVHQTITNVNNSELPEIVWPEQFLLGMYTANLSLSLSDNGPYYTRSINFIAFPANFVLGLLIVLALFIYIYKRVKNKIT